MDVSTFVRPSQFFYLGDGVEVRIDDLMAAKPSEADRYQEIAALNGIGIHDWIPFGRAVMLTGPAWDACLSLSSQSADRLIFDDLARRMVTD